jgi:HSP20 family protein
MTTNEVSGEVRPNPIQYASPRVEVFETEKAVLLAADMPGVSKSGVSIELDEGVLLLEGVTEKADHRSARHFRRRFTLTDPALFDVEKISAKMSDGVLEIEIPKAAKPEPRQIKISAT